LKGIDVETYVKSRKEEDEDENKMAL